MCIIVCYVELPDDAYDYECCCCLSDKDCLFKGNKEWTKLGEQTVNVDEAVHLHEGCRDVVNNSKARMYTHSPNLIFTFYRITSIDLLLLYVCIHNLYLSAIHIRKESQDQSEEVCYNSFYSILCTSFDDMYRMHDTAVLHRLETNESQQTCVD